MKNKHKIMRYSVKNGKLKADKKNGYICKFHDVTILEEMVDTRDERIASLRKQIDDSRIMMVGISYQLKDAKKLNAQLVALNDEMMELLESKDDGSVEIARKCLERINRMARPWPRFIAWLFNRRR